MRRKYWQKTDLCEVGCAYYAVRDDGTEACEKVGYRLHPDWDDVLFGCDDYETAEQKRRREAEAAAARALENRTSKKKK